MIPRRGRTVPALIVAVVAVAGGVTVAIDVIRGFVGQPPLIWPQQQIATQLRASHWNDIPILAVAAAFTFVGLLLLLAGLTRGKRQLIALTTDDPQVTTGVTARGLRQALTDAASQVEGIDHASVKLTRNTVVVKARSGLRDVAGLKPRVNDSVAQRLAGIGPVRPTRVKTRVVSKEM